MMDNGPLTQKKRQLWSDKLADVQKALEHFQAVLEYTSDDNGGWRESLMWETLDEARHQLTLDMMTRRN